MSDVNVLAAEPRERAGKGAARATRRAGRVPGVIYGAKEDPVLITMDPRDLLREINTGSFFASLLDIKVGKGNERVLPRDLQLHPVTDRPLHVDFLRVSQDTKINVEIPVNFLNEEESPGLKRGGVLNVVRYTVEVACRADVIPQGIDIDLTGRDIGDSVHISEVFLPDGVEPTITDRDFTIVTIAAPSVVEEEPTEGEEGELPEGEVPEGAEGETAEGEGEGESSEET